MNQYRQGDVLIEEIKVLPKQLNLKSQKSRVILAHGEATGHAHVIEQFRHVRRHDNEDGSFFLQIDTPVEVTHQEHSAITLPPGNFRVRRQREYSPAEIRNVAD